MLVYSVGAAMGPMGAAIAMGQTGTGGLFGFIALAAAGTLVFGLWRLATSAPVPGDAQQDFQILPRTTPVATLLDPAGPYPAHPPAAGHHDIWTGKKWTRK